MSKHMDEYKIYPEKCVYSRNNVEWVPCERDEAEHWAVYRVLESGEEKFVRECATEEEALAEVEEMQEQ